MTRDQIMQMVRESHLDVYGAGNDRLAFVTVIERFAALVAAHEREQCAKICETMNDGTPYNRAKESAEAIRARGNT